MLVLSALSAALAVAMVLGTRRVAELESHEHDLSGAVVTLDAAGPLDAGGSRTLLSAELAAHDHVTFELCSGDAMDAAVWATGPSVEIFFRTEGGHDLVDRRPLDASLLERARHASTGSCVVFDSARLTTGGTYEIRVSWDAPPAFASVPLRARVLTRRPLEASDGNLVFAALCLSLLIALAGGLRVTPAQLAADSIPHAGGRIALAIGLTMLAMTGFSLFAPGGRTAGLISGLVLAAVEIALALALARPPRGDRLAWGRHERLAMTAAGLLVAPFAGIALRFAAIESLAAVPSTGEAPIEAFVSLPSGMLSFALIAVVAPLAEETFFRGLIFGTLADGASRTRLALAFAGAWLLFGVVHLPQTWGNWGGLLAITVAGLAFTTLRAIFRSTLVPALAHLVYNGLLAAMALASAIAASPS